MRQWVTVAACAVILSACGNAEETTATEENNTAAAPTMAASESAAADAGMAATAESGMAAEPEAADAANTNEGTWGDIVYGSEDAPVTIIEYASMTCPHCANFALQTFPKLKEKYIDTGRVRFIFRNFVTNRYDLAASTGARCPTMEGAKELTKLYFAKQKEWGQSKNPVDELAAIARRVGVSRAKFDQCLANRDMHEHLVQMSKDGQAEFDITATPTVLVDGVKVENHRWENLDKVLGEKF